MPHFLLWSLLKVCIACFVGFFFLSFFNFFCSGRGFYALYLWNLAIKTMTKNKNKQKRDRKKFCRVGCSVSVWQFSLCSMNSVHYAALFSILEWGGEGGGKTGGSTVAALMVQYDLVSCSNKLPGQDWFIYMLSIVFSPSLLHSKNHQDPPPPPPASPSEMGRMHILLHVPRYCQVCHGFESNQNCICCNQCII